MAALYQTAHPAPAASADIRRIEFNDGTVVEHDRGSSITTVDTPGDVVVKAGRSITANADVDIAADAGGNITASAGNEIQASAGSMISATAPLINLSGNIVTTGSGGGTGSAEVHADLRLIGSMELTGPLTVTGNVDINGQMEVAGHLHATGTIMDDSGNSGNHSH